MGKATRKFFIAGAGLAAVYSIMKAAAKRKMEGRGMDDIKPADYTEDYGGVGAGIYQEKVKPFLDQILSFGGLVILSPLYAAVALSIKIDDPGPVFFTQKRIGRGKTYFMCHKFRSMRVGTPHDVPTHQLLNPEAYITRVGRVLRRTSLDELPQVWDIFRGKMSIVGPRPALWNQEDLISFRDKYEANDVLPGLTGFAQIHGRDELEIPDKARLDGEYARVLKAGGWKAFFNDCKLFFGTVASVLKHDGVVEGGAGGPSAQNDDFLVRRAAGMRLAKAEDIGFDDYGFKKTFHIDKDVHKKVLILGADSYVGDSFRSYCENYYPNIECTVIDMLDGSWRNYSFEGYDTVFHVAGIAHADVGSVTPEQQKLYYDVNETLAIKTAEKSRQSGVKQFIYISSIIIYGRIRFIDEHTVPSPANFYGDSKWQGDRGVRRFSTQGFNVAVLRLPMVFGKGSKGNYQILSRIAKKVRVFPKVNNQRSMIYVENLCEFVCLLILSGEGGIYFPQNAEYSNTSALVKSISEISGKRLWETKVLVPAVKAAFHIPGRVQELVTKAFGSSCYDQRMSAYDGLDYNKVGLEESIRRTEG